MNSSAFSAPPAAGRVVFVITGLERGGAEVQVYELATRLLSRGWRVAVISILPLSGWAEALARSGVEVLSLDLRPRFPNPWALFRLVRLFRRLCPDIVHSHMVHANLFARMVRPFAPMPVLVCTAHSVSEGGRLRMWLYRVTDRFCDLTTQVSEAGLARYRQIGAISADKSRFVPNGLDVGGVHVSVQEREATRAELMPHAGFMWLAVGLIAERKDYPNLVAAYAQVASKQPDSMLFVAGGGDPSTLQALARQYGIGAQLKFLGLRDDVPRLLHAADGLVMSSKNEGMPMVLLEVAAAGLPAVATDTGGVAEIVTDAARFVVPPQSPSELAGAMLRLMALSPSERAVLGRTSQQHLAKKYDIDEVVTGWETIYAGLRQRKSALAER